ncbi:3-hydroxyadipyl-CoA dehydrogenase [Georgfuchsia toluolica]|uniref:3-hydroxyadipyl-CoA dehydrogenase n=1 Tax=Georgfuchsia toluolica TaxID=424218 RepID=A0A916N9G3_9PROT|nr:3-hydroxyacyl-CoA dehydrogenase PaaH [Georgfuchsia toluolica]CAG4883915.1 3-hydroxyadipyl-CoA dehydrogenase [Georgfuchsia toluolica]
MTALATSVRVLVVGAGAMGSGIAHVAARAGHSVYLFDQNAEAVDKGKVGIDKDLRFLVNKGKLSEADYQTILARVIPVTRLEDAADAGLAIEAIIENLTAKQELFAQLEKLLSAEAILATNTSSLSITAMAANLAQSQRLAGLHFFNPAPRMALVEIVSGLATDPAIADCLYATARAWGKVPVHAKSTPGFIVNRVARPYYAEALRVLGEQAATPATLDALLRDSCRFPMGPFELMDMIGHDINFAVTRSVYDAYFGDKRFVPSLIQQELVLAGRLGRKTGQGFFAYGDNTVKPAPDMLAAMPAPAKVVIAGDLGPAAALAQRLETAGVVIEYQQGNGCLQVGGATLALSDGRPATIRTAAENIPDLVLFDLAFDYATTTRLAVTRADQCSDAAFAAAVGTLQATGIAVSQLDDVAGIIALRTVCMLANEGADAVSQGIASAADVNAAMTSGTNYPLGPLAWAEKLGFARVVRILENLHAHYGEERYRLSPWLRRRAVR